MFHHPRFIFTKDEMLEAERVAESRSTKAKLAEAKIERLEAERAETEKALNAEMPKGNSIYPLNELKKISSEGESSSDNHPSLLGKGSEEHHTEQYNLITYFYGLLRHH